MMVSYVFIRMKRKFQKGRKETMKIIQKGSPRQKNCPTCGCLFEYDICDINHIPGMTFLNKGSDIIYCPQCGERILEECGLAVNSLGHFK